MAEKGRTLPDYDRPPVIETVLGVQFNRLARFSIPHFGLYWAGIRDKYPRHEVQHPLGSVTEEFGQQKRVQTPEIFGLAEFPEVRCWFIEPSGTRLIQLQNGRFIYNWRKVNDEDIYAHYDDVRPRFINEWQTFCAFLTDAGLEQPDVNQCEVTYVNHIEIGAGWDSYADLHHVIAYWSGASSGTFLPEPESVTIGARYLMPKEKGRLHVQMQPAIRKRDAKEILQLNLTARGKPHTSRLEDILEWFDLGHEWIVRGFTDFTTKEIHTRWGRKI